MNDFRLYVLLTIKALKTISGIVLILLGAFLGLKCVTPEAKA